MDPFSEDTTEDIQNDYALGFLDSWRMRGVMGEVRAELLAKLQERGAAIPTGAHWENDRYARFGQRMVIDYGEVA